MLLDVFDHNIVAKNWYKRLGFQHEFSTDWWDVPVVVSNDCVFAVVSEYPHARLSQHEFGFSQFKLMTAKGKYTVGRMGEDWFRLTRPEALVDPAVSAALSRLDPRRRILALIQVSLMRAPLGEQVRLLATSRRMSVELDILMKKLI